MENEWLSGTEGHNHKYSRETLLNYAMNRWGMNKAGSVGPTSELIRSCAPASCEEWEAYYFANAVQKKLGGERITREYIRALGERLYHKLSENVQSELASITEEECIDYVYNLVINRTYEGYRTEITTIYGTLQALLGCKVVSAPDEWDRKYAVDFYIEAAKGKYIGIQIKPISAKGAPEDYRWLRQNEDNNRKFTARYGGRVFFVFSKKSPTGKKQIDNIEVVDEIKKEITRLQQI